MVIQKSYIIIFILTFLFIVNLYPQNEQIEKKQTELERIRKEIADLEKDLAQKSKREKKSLEVYEKLGKQSFLVNKLVSQLRSEEYQKQVEIDNLGEKIKNIEDDIDILQKNYAKYVKSTYKYGNFTELESLLNARSFQQAIIRMEYLKRFSNNRERDLVKLEANKLNLILAKEQLEIEKEQKRILTDQKVSEEKVLEKKINEQKSLLISLKKDKSKITKSVSAKRKSEKQIKDLILKLVEEAELKKKETEIANNQTLTTSRKNANNNTQSEFNIDLTTVDFVSFLELKGKLNWPINKGKVVRKFGETKNQKLNTVTVNYGIDIRASGDLNVKCVAEGVVSAVEWLPGYGTVLIISHKGSYRTVYGHLGEVYVSEGDKLKTSGLIAKVGESLEGNILHFEIWNARQNVNPELWLK